MTESVPEGEVEDVLASIDDVEAAFGRDLTEQEKDRVGFILAKASELFRRESGQHFTHGETVARVKVNGGRAFLKQHPVVKVHSVTDGRGNDVSFTIEGQWIVTRSLSHEFLTVGYEHGGGVPELVRLTVADIARQVLSINPRAVTGITQASTTTGPFSDQYTYATWAQGGATRLAPDDLAIARSFRKKIPNIWVAGR